MTGSGFAVFRRDIQGEGDSIGARLAEEASGAKAGRSLPTIPEAAALGMPHRPAAADATTGFRRPVNHSG